MPLTNASSYALCCVGAYLTGAIPWGYLVARLKGVRILAVGSGNIGATNVFRNVGKAYGIATFLLDVAKGFIPPFLYPRLTLGEGVGGADESDQWLILLCGVFAIVGHCWSVFLGFRGGKGVATSLGVAFGMAPTAALLGFGAWSVVFCVSGYVSLASIVAAVALSGTVWYFYAAQGLALPMVFTILAAFVVYRHKANISRLLKGVEPRFNVGLGRKRTVGSGAR